MKKYIVLLVIILLGLLGLYIGPSHKENKTLVAYFSATGTTERVAKELANVTGGDLFVIQPVIPYTAEDLNWQNDKSRSSVEMADHASRPEITSKIDNVAQYDLVFVGFPIWWGREPSIIDTFIESYNFAGKTIVPFATSGSTPTTDAAAENIRALAPKATVPNGKRFPADVSGAELKQWASEWK